MFGSAECHLGIEPLMEPSASHLSSLMTFTSAISLNSFITTSIASAMAVATFAKAVASIVIGGQAKASLGCHS